MTLTRHPDPDASRALESLLAFWAEAGVELSYEDEPVDRLARGAARLAPRSVAVAASARPSPKAGLAAAMPSLSAAVDKARVLAAAANDLSELEAAITAFDGCALKRQGASRVVFSRGNPQGPIMIIGEGPGTDEDRQGMPFVGRAGNLLDKMLAAAGLPDQAFIINTVFWHAPGSRPPTAEEQAVCLPFVERAIALVNPSVLFLVGGASAKAMLKQDQGILSLRGRWFDWRSSDGALDVPAMPSLHPAFLLRQPAAKKNAWSDLLALAERLDRPRLDP